MLAQATQTQASLTEDDLAAAEAEALRKEQLIENEAARLKNLRKEAVENISRAKADAPSVAGLEVPSVSIRAQLDEARLARLKAIGARKSAADSALKALRVHEVELDRLFDSVRDAVKAADQQRQAQAAKEAEESLAATMIRAIESQAAEAMAELEAPAPVPAAASVVAAKPTVVERRPAPAAAPPAQRRTAQRVSLCAEISLGSDSNFFTGFTNDVSEGGVFVATINVMPIGTQIDISFQLPGGPKIEGKGEVRWVREFDDRNPEVFPGMGVQFTDIPLPSVQAIHSFTQQREPMFFPEA
ncbi:MAG: TIGR02266 family protein [Myxococcaceae bacterium]|nr:TIGR02266 family protein [Myxococcaceae bacterium]